MRRLTVTATMLSAAILAACSALGTDTASPLPTFIDEMPYIVPSTDERAGMMALGGTVQVRLPNTGDEGWRVVTGPMQIPHGTDIATDDDAVAHLLFPRGATVLLAPSTLLRITQYPKHRGEPDTNLRLYGGELWSVVPSDPQVRTDFRVRTDQLLAIVRGAQGATFTVASGPTRSRAFSASGTVLVRTDAENERLTLDARRGVLVGGDGISVLVGGVPEEPWYRWNVIREASQTGELPTVEDLMTTWEPDWIFDGELVLPPLPEPSVDADAWYGEFIVPMDADAQEPGEPGWHDPWEAWNTWDAWDDTPTFQGDEDAPAG